MQCMETDAQIFCMELLTGNLCDDDKNFIWSHSDNGKYGWQFIVITFAIAG